MKRKSFFINIALLAIVLLSLARPALALEVNYPILPGEFGAPNINVGEPNIEGFITYFFSLAIILSGMIGIISIVYSGIRILIFSGNPSERSAAFDRIFNSVLGIVLLLFSVVILRTVNPELVNPSSSSSSVVSSGVYLMGSGGVLKPAPSSIVDTSDPTEFDPKYTGIVYACTPPGNNVIVNLFNKSDFSTVGGATSVTLPCGGSGVNIGSFANPNANPSDSTGSSSSGSDVSVGVGSFEVEYEDAGVYYYLGDNCTGLSSEIQKTKGQIPLFGNESIVNMKGQTIKSVKIVNGSDLNKRYGVILNKNPDGSGECSAPLLNPKPGFICFNLTQNPQLFDLDNKPFEPSYGYVVKLFDFEAGGNKNEGVNFFSTNFFVGLSAAMIGNQYSIYPGYNGTNNGFKGTPDQFMRPQCSQSDPGCPPEGGGLGVSTTGDAPGYECTIGDPYGTCIDNINPTGSFYEVLYAKNDIDINKDGVADIKDRSCRVYSNGVGGLKDDTEDFMTSNRKLYRMDIFPRN